MLSRLVTLGHEKCAVFIQIIYLEHSSILPGLMMIKKVLVLANSRS